MLPSASCGAALCIVNLRPDCALLRGVLNDSFLTNAWLLHTPAAIAMGCVVMVRSMDSSYVHSKDDSSLVLSCCRHVHILCAIHSCCTDFASVQLVLLSIGMHCDPGCKMPASLWCSQGTPLKLSAAHDAWMQQRLRVVQAGAIAKQDVSKCVQEADVSIDEVRIAQITFLDAFIVQHSFLLH